MNENEKNNNTKNVIPPDSAQQTMGTAPDKELTTLLADDWDIGCDSMLTMEKKNSNPEDQARAEKLITSLARASGEHARPELALRKLVAPSAPTPPSVAKPPAARPPVAAPPPPPPPPARRRHIDSQHESPASVVPGKAIPLPPVSRE
ncbi:MAG: hypothetical protein K8F91_26160, partial [Candidatus Obscuribacterales bacterium]|nr:hypothetical protein [Candidatus Obscuribacterales bacterium]